MKKSHSEPSAEWLMSEESHAEEYSRIKMIGLHSKSNYYCKSKDE